MGLQLFIHGGTRHTRIGLCTNDSVGIADWCPLDDPNETSFSAIAPTSLSPSSDLARSHLLSQGYTHLQVSRAKTITLLRIHDTNLRIHETLSLRCLRAMQSYFIFQMISGSLPTQPSYLSLKSRSASSLRQNMYTQPRFSSSLYEDGAYCSKDAGTKGVGCKWLLDDGMKE